MSSGNDMDIFRFILVTSMEAPHPENWLSDIALLLLAVDGEIKLAWNEDKTDFTAQITEKGLLAKEHREKTMYRDWVTNYPVVGEA